MLMEADDCCPLCMEDMDVTDRNFRPCKCGYQICLFCYRHIKEDLNGLCPACRTPYDEANATFVTPDPQEMAKMAREKKAKELREKKEQQAKEAKEKREAELKSRQEVQQAATAARSTATTNSASASGSGSTGCSTASSSTAAALLASGGASNSAGAGLAPRQTAKLPMRSEVRETRQVSPRTVIFVTGLSPRIAKEEILRRNEYFGQYGKILKVLLSPPSSTGSGPPSNSCSITYATRDEADQAILAVDGVALDGRTLKAIFAPAGSVSRPTAAYSELDISAGGGLASIDKEPTGRLDSARCAPYASQTPAQPREPGPRSCTAARDVPDSELVVAPCVSAAATSSVKIAPGRGAAVTASNLALERVTATSPVQGLAPIASWPTPGSSIGMSCSSVADAEREAPSACSCRAPGLTCGKAGTTGSATTDRPSTAESGQASAPTPPHPLTPPPPAPPARGDPALICALPVCPTGAEAEPWSLSGFEGLLTTIVADDAEDSESFPSASRFARFFKECADEADEQASVAASRTLGASTDFPEVKIESDLGSKQAEDWQEGFRALLPNVNISFSPLNIGGLDGLGTPLSGVAGFGGASHQAPISPSRSGSGLAAGSSGAVGRVVSDAVGSSACACPNGNTSCVGSSLSRSSLASIAQPDHAAGVGCATSGCSGMPGVYAGGSLSGSLSSSPQAGEAALSQFASGSSLLSSQPLPGAQLSSQLQSLLQGSSTNAPSANAASAAGRAVGATAPGGTASTTGAGGRSMLQNGDPTAPNGLWIGGSACGSCLIPGWLPSEGLLHDGIEASKDLSAAGAGLGKKDSCMPSASGSGGGNGAAAAAAAAAAAVNDRNKPKKRGGTGNRGKADLKSTHK